jgi:hypothetical protein
MKIRGLIGIVLIFQAIGVLSLRKVVDTNWLIFSIVLGVVGFLLLWIRPGKPDLESFIVSEGVTRPLLFCLTNISSINRLFLIVRR